MTGSNHSTDLRDRTTEFALRIIHLYAALPKSSVARILGKQPNESIRTFSIIMRISIFLTFISSFSNPMIEPHAGLKCERGLKRRALGHAGRSHR